MVRFVETQPRRGILQSGGFYMLLLALQFGCQPLLVQTFISKDSPKVTVVRATEGLKILLCLAFLLAEGGDTVARIRKTWTLRESLRLAALPAACYAVQNVLAQVGYQNLDSLTYNLLNQTKTIAAAVCLFLLTGKRQSGAQLVALALLLIASVMVNYKPSSSGGSSSSSSSSSFTTGVVAVLLASFLSGLSAAVTEKILQGLSRNSYLFSMELALYGQVVLLAMPALLQLAGLGEGAGGMGSGGSGGAGGGGACSSSWWWWAGGHWWECGLSLVSASFRGWTWWTLVPVLSNSLGGIIVGLVTKYAGGVSKGFALIAGILLTAFLQSVVTKTPPEPLHWVAALLVVVSTYLHANYPPGPPPTPSTAVAQASARTSNGAHSFAFSDTRELAAAEGEQQSSNGQQQHDKSKTKLS